MNTPSVTRLDNRIFALDISKPVKVDIGAGDTNKKTPLEDWIHIDGVYSDHIEIVCDFAEIPLPDSIADEIFSGDTIEHLVPHMIDKSLREWNRITKLGGLFTGRCPNLHSTMVRYTKGELSLQDALGALYGSQDSIWQQHYITYTADTLIELLKRYGFGEIDLTGSPGYDPKTQSPGDSWWLVWSAIKVKNV